jgi:hypothetical protein
MKIGILKETGSEKRVAILPEGTELAGKNEHDSPCGTGCGRKGFCI